MMHYLIVLFILSYQLSLQASPIEPIIVTEQSLQINGEQRFFFAFEEGDQIVMDIAMIQGKFIKEFEVLVYPETSKLQELKLEALQGKTLRVFKRGVYEFRFKSGGPKTVKFKVKRIPYNTARINFDTNVKWKTVQDTIRKNYSESIQIVYDTSFVTKYRRVLKKIDTAYISVANQQERVHSRTNLSNDNVNTLMFNLPPAVDDNLLKKKVVSWSYWVGVGQEGTDNYNEELKQFLRTAATKIMSKNLLVGLALGVYSVSTNPPKGENIHYNITVQNPKGIAHVAKGNVTAAFGRETHRLEGKIHVSLTNDNIMNGLNVSLKILAVVQKQIYVLEGYQERIITPLEMKDTKGRVFIREREVPLVNNW